jgi:hypothetical protein
MYEVTLPNPVACAFPRRRLDVADYSGNGDVAGAIPKSLSDLTALTYLDFSYNPSITKLPYFGNLKKLE